MSDVRFPTIDDDELHSDTFVDGAAIRVVLTGSADTRAMAALDGLLKAVHAAAVEGATKEVIVDMRKLEFMNSSCFKAFVSWITTVQELQAGQQYKIRIVSDETKHWQRRSLGALACFAVDLIGIET